MFTWSHEHSIEVDLPLQTAWDFLISPNNWPKWEGRFEACSLEGAFKAGAKIKAKIKNKSAYIPIFITDVKPYHECRVLMRVLFSSQESLCSFQEISAQKTRITLRTHIISLFTPFMKSSFLKSIGKFRAKLIEAFAEVTEKQLDSSK